MTTWIETESARSATVESGRVNVLKKLSLVLRYSSVPKARAILHSPDIATEYTGSTSVQTANKHVFTVTVIVRLHRGFFGRRQTS
jgi:hypothetical protein